MLLFFKTLLLSWTKGIAVVAGVLLYSISTVWGQSPDTTIAHQHWQEGELSKQEGDTESALLHFQKSRTEFEKSNFFNRAGQLAVREGVAYYVQGDLEKADSLMDFIVQKSGLEGKCEPAVRAAWHLFQGQTRFALGEGDLALSSFLEAKSWAESTGNPNAKAAEAVYWAGKANHFLLEELEAAEADYLEAIGLWESNNGQDSVSLSMARLVLGSLYSEMGDYERAGQVLEWVLKVRESLFGKRHPMVANACVSLGNVQYEQNHFQGARTYFERALSIREEEPTRNAASIALLHNNLGALWDALGQPDSGLVHYRKALAFYSENLGKDHPEVGGILLSMGIAEQNRQDSAAAMNYYKKALDIRTKEEAESNAGASDVFVEMSRLCADGNDFDAAIAFAHEGMAYLDKSFVPSNAFDHPNPMPGPRAYQLLRLYGAKAIALEGKARALDRGGKEATPYWRACTAVYGLADALVDGMRRSFQGHGSKGFLGQEAHGIYLNAVEVHLNLWRQKGESENLEQAFHFAEKSKFMVVWEALAEREAAAATGLPPEIAAEEWHLRREIARLDGQLEEAENGYLDWTAKEELACRDSLNRLLADQDSFVEGLRVDYPDYFRLYHGGGGNSIADLQTEVLDENTCMLHYFVGTKAVHLFVLTKEAFHCIDLPDAPGIQEKVVAFCNLANGLRQDNGGSKLYPLGHELYSELVAPGLAVWEGLSKGETGRLLVVADGPLGALPFEALVTERLPNGGGRFLLEDYRVAYGFSGALQCALFGKTGQRGNGKCLAFAWSAGYRGNAGGETTRGQRAGVYRNLPGSFEEVQALGKHFESDLYFGATAEKNRFLSAAERYSVLHFALHGELVPGDGMQSHLVFPPDSTRPAERLYAYELFGLRMDAELAVLSACETGAGDWVPGEGVHSLARAFAYNGVPAVVSTLWKVEDASSERLMDRFYAGLAEGLGKDDALREAKLDLIQSGGKHGRLPFYWAAYVLTGDWRPLDAVQSTGQNGWLWWGISGGLLLVLAFVAYQKLKLKT